MFSLFHAGQGDEAVWGYQASLIAQGLTPGTDFFAHHTTALLSWYAGMFRLLSPSLEAGRLTAFLLCFGSMAFLYLTLRRVYGLRTALIGLLVYAANVEFMVQDFDIHGIAPMAFGACGMLYFLLRRDRPNTVTLALLGLFVGIMVGGRLPVGFASLAVAAYVLFAHPDDGRSRRQRWLGLALVVAASLVPLVFDLHAIAHDPSRWVWAHVTGIGRQVDVKLAQSRIAPTVTSWLIALPMGVWGLAKADAGHIPGQNLTLALMLVLVLAKALWAKLRHGLAWAEMASPPTRWMLAVMVCALGGLSIGWLLAIEGDTYSMAFPLIAAAGTGLAADIVAALARRRIPPTPGLKLVLVVAGLWYGLVGVAHVGWQIAFRHAAGYSEPLVVDDLACWVDRATSPSDEVLSAWAAVDLDGGRRLPTGFEEGGVIGNWWYSTPAELDHAGIVTPAELADRLRRHEVALYLDDYLSDIVTKLGETGLRDALAETLVPVGTFGGKLFPYRIYADRQWLARRTQPLPPLPPERYTQANFALLHTAGFGPFAAAVAHDLADSVRLLPRDLHRVRLRLFDGTSCDRP